MEEYRLIKEAIFYTKKYQSAVIAIFLGDENIQKCQERGLLQSIRFLKKIGMSIVIGHYTKALSTKNWHDTSDVFKICELDIKTIKRLMAAGLIPVIYCEDKEFSSYEIFARLAANVKAQKLIYITRQEGVYDVENGILISEMSSQEAKDLLNLADNATVTLRMKKKISSAIIACEKGVSRVHIISGKKNGSLINEIFSCQGNGTMIYKNQYRNIRKAKKNEINDLICLFHSSDPPILISSTEIRKKINQWYVFVIDNQVHGCMKLSEYPESNSLGISFLTVSKSEKDYMNLKQMILYAIKKADSSRLETVFIEKSKTTVWLGIYPWLYKDFGFYASYSFSGVKKSEYWIKEK